MQLKTLKLSNIRSYITQEVIFPKGSLLLAGDIGSGKSTILLAIEFALFGLKQGELTGDALLRHDAKEGSVELHFEIDGKDIIVKRTLKRVKDKIGQGSGFIVIDGVKSEMMPKEIKTKIFQLLNYPESSVTKSQDLIYRFTVYTPQEEMKRIIYSDKDSRLETLRKVFNIDKYKRIKENSVIYCRALKEKRALLEGRTENLESRKKISVELQEKIAALSQKLEAESSELAKSKDNSQKNRSLFDELQEQMNIVNQSRKELALVEYKIKNSTDTIEKCKKEIDELMNNISLLRDELKDYHEDLGVQNLLQDKELRKDTIEKELSDLRARKSELKGKVLHLKQSSEKITKIDNCPYCMQSIAHSHKEKIIANTNLEITSLHAEFEAFGKKELEFLQAVEHLKKECKELSDRLYSQKLLRLKKDNLIEKEKRLAISKSLFEESQKIIFENSEKRQSLLQKIDPGFEERFQQAKKEYEISVMLERKLEVNHSGTQREMDGLKKQLDQISLEIIELERSLLELESMKKLESWMSGSFINFLDNLEKHVMLAVYHEFNDLFKSWFSMLMQDENMSASLDDTFSVLISQNGHDTLVDYLSGGEKTSIALAYRLALNKVINDVVSQIKTKDVLILDEPTDGFSSAQLDRVRDVLEQVGIKQIIIVSHESKIESFVDNIIKVVKDDSVSRVIIN